MGMGGPWGWQVRTESVMPTNPSEHHAGSDGAEDKRQAEMLLSRWEVWSPCTNGAFERSRVST